MGMNRSWMSVAVLLALGTVAPVLPAQAAEACSAARRAMVLSPAAGGLRSVRIDCDLTLSQDDVVTRQIIFDGKAASGLTLDCKGALLDGGPGLPNDGRDMILIRSRGNTPEEMAADRPQGITIRDCRVHGSIRIEGLGGNGEARKVQASSVTEGHTARAQAAAPTDIALDRIEVTATGRIPLYLAPGVTNVRVSNSSFKGFSDATGVYLDAESAGNSFTDNHFAVETKSREQVAVDGSADNRFSGNRFTRLEHGGIYLYRNCGEGGTVRHQTPHGNVIEANRFDHAAGEDAPAIWLGSRSEGFNLMQVFCMLDKGYPFGSSADDRDHAEDNSVTGNVFHGIDPRAAIKDDGANNRVEGNSRDDG